MNYKELLISIYDEARKENSYISKIDPHVLENIKIITEKCFTQKGVYTVLITLSIYKILHPQQDIRHLQQFLKRGFKPLIYGCKIIVSGDVY